jgi:hypothetical protein
VHDENVAGHALIDQRKERWATHIAALPIVLAVYFDGFVE